ncbi:hypothetical protein FZ934_15165 [Rhizobium grahamii]|uniref:Uncharacterized protein n=1 Tax=Rhizobium grahamii TaxID=1120045 RepID=A0A5Q0CB45_9HYPH|nr:MULTISPECIES: hypothetical protein [Rhizobium]QFY61624.1 hypothetical protein FZ934_15165 [Rhizobium grahamii]QRM49218.1 hypothetical protein F3Y33_07725 [Rhizobium sp. BG6]
MSATSRLLVIAVAATVALPALAGDFGGYHAPRHRGFVHREPFTVGHLGFSGRQIAFGRHHDGFDNRPWRNRLLKRFDRPNQSYGRGNVTIVLQATGNAASFGTYAGSSYAYDVDGGTYVTGGGYRFYAASAKQALAPKAKVIDVAKGNSCSYEAGVCVIRP